MSSMNERESSMKRYSAHCSDGFVSTWFLICFLCISELCAVSILIQKFSMMTVLNLRTDTAYFVQEASAIAALKCELENREEEEEVQAIRTIVFEGSLPETITVYLDPVSGRIINCVFERNTNDVYSEKS